MFLLKIFWNVTSLIKKKLIYFFIYITKIKKENINKTDIIETDIKKKVFILSMRYAYL